MMRCAAENSRRSPLLRLFIIGGLFQATASELFRKQPHEMTNRAALGHRRWKFAQKLSLIDFAFIRKRRIYRAENRIYK